MNPHRGDTNVEVGGKSYTICYDLNACAKVMERLGVKTFSDMSEGVNFMNNGMTDLIYILWCGFNRHHPDLSVEDVGGMEWDLTEITDKIADSFQRGLMREVPKGKTKSSRLTKDGGKPEADPLPSGTGNSPS